MTRADFIEATGENPEDVLGADWENIVAEMESVDKFDEARYEALQETYSKI